MSAETGDLVFDLGPQNDGEPVAVEPVPEPTPEPPAEPEAAPAEPMEGDEPEAEPEETPEQVEERKRLTGSARKKAENERLRAQNSELLDRLSRLEQGHSPKPTAPVVAAIPGAPDQDVFFTENPDATFTDFVRVLARFEAKHEREQERITEQWETKKAQARKEIPDFDDVLSDMIEAPAPVVLAVMNASDHIAKIAYHLAQNPDELQRINRLAPPQAALEVARIEARFTRTSPPAPKPVSKAPRPPSPVSAPSAPKPSDDGRLETY